MWPQLDSSHELEEIIECHCDGIWLPHLERGAGAWKLIIRMLWEFVEFKKNVIYIAMSLVDSSNYYDVINRHWAKLPTVCTSPLTSSRSRRSVWLSPHVCAEAQIHSVTRGVIFYSAHMAAKNRILGWVPFPVSMSPSRSGIIIPDLQLRIPAWVPLLGVNLRIMWRLLLHTELIKPVTPRGSLLGWKSRSREVCIRLWKNVLSGNRHTSQVCLGTC